MEASVTDEPGTIPVYLKKIKHYRGVKGLNQEQLADMLHISQRTYCSMERGETELSVPRLSEIAKVLEVPFYEIMGEDPKNVYNNHFDNNPNNKGTNNYQSNNEDLKSLYERLLEAKDILLKAKDDEIKSLKEKLEQYERLLQAKDDEIKRLKGLA